MVPVFASTSRSVAKKRHQRRQATSQDFPSMDLGAAEDGFVNFAIRILRQHRAERAVGSHGTATVADREVAAGETVFVFHQMFRSLDKLAPRRTLAQHPREVGLAEHVAE